MSLINSNKSVSRQRVACPSLLQYACENREIPKFNNVTIKVENEIIYANRLVLSCYSKFFETILQSEANEQDPNSIELNDIDAASAKLLIDYIYTGNILIDSENVMKLLTAANNLQLNEVKEFCSEFLEDEIAVENCLLMLTFADSNNCNALKASAFKCISNNFDQIAKRENFENLTKDELISFLLNLDRKQIKEAAVYDSIISWIRHDEDNRKNDLSDLLEHVDLHQISSDYLADVIAKENLVKENISCVNLVMSVFAMKIKEKDIKIVDKLPLKTMLALVVSSSGNHMFEYDQQFAKYDKSFPSMRQPTLGHCMEKLGTFIYQIGGRKVKSSRHTSGHAYSTNQLTNITANVWRMNLEGNVHWEKVTEMNFARCWMGAAIVNESLVISGGYDGRVALASTEIFKKKVNGWKELSFLNQNRYGNALVNCNDCLYALGGRNELEALSSVESLSGVNEKWIVVEPMQNPRYGLAAVSLSGFIYAIGGESETGQTLQSVERYDVSKKTWCNVCEMNVKRYAHTACVVEDKIFVAGGLDADGIPVKEIECYDLESDVWNIVGRKDDLIILSLVAL